MTLQILENAIETAAWCVSSALLWRQTLPQPKTRSRTLSQTLSSRRFFTSVVRINGKLSVHSEKLKKFKVVSAAILSLSPEAPICQVQMAILEWTIDTDVCDVVIILGTGDSQVRYSASSHMLCVASPEWKRMLTACDGENEGSKVLEIPEGNANALVIILRLVHHQYDWSQANLSFDLIFAVTHLAYLYKLHRFLRQTPYQVLWSKLLGATIISPEAADQSKQKSGLPSWVKVLAIFTLCGKTQFEAAFVEHLRDGLPPGDYKDYVASGEVKALMRLYLSSAIHGTYRPVASTSTLVAPSQAADWTVTDQFIHERKYFIKNLNRVCKTSTEKLISGHEPCIGHKDRPNYTDAKTCRQLILGHLMSEGGVNGIANTHVDVRDVCNLQSVVVPLKTLTGIVQEFRGQWTDRSNSAVLKNHQKCLNFILNQIHEAERPLKKWTLSTSLSQEFDAGV